MNKISQFIDGKKSYAGALGVGVAYGLNALLPTVFPEIIFGLSLMTYLIGLAHKVQKMNGKKE